MALKLVISTISSLEEAKNLAEQIVTQKLAACVNTIHISDATYLWQDKLESSQEYLLLIKTMEENLKNLEEFLINEHPYDTPCFIVLDTEKVSEQYLKWAKSS